MSLLVQAAPAEHLPWLAERTGAALSAGARAIEALDRAGRIRGMVAYDRWTDASVEAHMATEAPIVWRSLAAPAFRYPLEEAGREQILGLIRSDNLPSLRMALALGFTVEHRLRGAAASGVDLVLVRMRKQDCRWLSSPPAVPADPDSLLEAL